MAWVARLNIEQPDIQEADWRVQVSIRYKDGKREFRVLYPVTPTTDMTYFRDVAAKRIADLNAVDANVAALVEGLMTPTLKTASQAEIDLANFLAALEKVRANKRAIAAKIMAPDAAQVTTDRNAFKTAYAVNPDVFNKYLGDDLP